MWHLGGFGRRGHTHTVRGSDLLTFFPRKLSEIEKAIENAGSLEMAFLEKNMGWLTAIIAIAPMMGFTGTVAGMIFAFDAANKHLSFFNPTR